MDEDYEIWFIAIVSVALITLVIFSMVQYRQEDELLRERGCKVTESKTSWRGDVAFTENRWVCPDGEVIWR